MVAACTGGWTPDIGEFPYPPANVMVMHSFMQGCLDIRWDDPSTLATGPTVATAQASGYLTIGGTPSYEVTATGTVTVAAFPVPAGQTLTIGGVTLTSVAGARTSGNNDFNGSLGTTDAIASDITDAINDFNNSLNGTVTATVVGSVITITSDVGGALGNAVTLTTSTATLTLSGATLAGGVDGDTVTINGIVLTAVLGARTPGGQDFSIDGTVNDIAQSLTDAINDTANGLSAYVTASVTYNRVTVTAVPIGDVGNQYNLLTSSTVITTSGDTLTGGTGYDCGGKSNSRWTIIGANIYRSDTGERGPYFRVNHIPIGGTFFRDCTDNVLVENEVVLWDWAWISKGDSANNRRWRFRTRHRPIVKRDSQAVPADSPADVSVAIDGQWVPVENVFGPTGEIDLINQPTYDQSTETTVPPLLPNTDGSSLVTVTYRYQGNLVKTDLATKAKIHYRVTTVAVDPTGSSPSGLVESPIGYSEPVSPIHTEQIDYIWREAVRRNRWVLEQGGERVKLFIRRVTGIPCPCQWDPRLFEYSQQPYTNCEECFGTGYVGGYEGPIDIIIGPDDAEQAIQQTMQGRKKSHQYEVWTGPRPLLTQRDFIVKQNGERFSIGPVRYTSARGVVLQQSFNIGYLDECDIRYKVPLYGLEQLPWPETRYTNPEDAPCVESDPYPVGYDYQATPMGTEVAKIPDGRELRGRTPVWANLTYGGNG